MNLIESPFSSIQENLALEQFLMKEEGEYFLLYNNQNCIVIGRNQVFYSEIAIREQLLHNIPVFRRYSGGGAVFHDKGTLNYAFITNYNYLRSSYSYFNHIIIQVLSEIGFEDIKEKGCNIYHKNFKISGTAQYKRRNRFVHHGTLLISTNLQLLTRVFFQSGNYITKAKRSEPAPTENLINIVPKITIAEFEKSFIRILGKKFCKSKIVITADVLDYVIKKKTDFEDKSWTFGNSPNYEFYNKILLPKGKSLNFHFNVRKGKVIEQFLSKNTPLSKIEFTGNYHAWEDFFPIIFHAIGSDNSFNDVNKICYQFFNSEKRA